MAPSPPVVAIEGASAVGKTTLARTLASEHGAAVVYEHEGMSGEPPPRPDASAWFVERSAARWGLARERGANAPFIVLDGDPFKGLWYDWIYAAEGWAGVNVVAPLYREHIAQGTLAFPDLYAVLCATETELRHRRANDPTRRRRNFEKHLLLTEPQRRYFEALAEVAPERVVFLDSGTPTELAHRVMDALARVPADPPDSLRLLERAVEWVRRA